MHLIQAINLIPKVNFLPFVFFPPVQQELLCHHGCAEVMHIKVLWDKASFHTVQQGDF